LITVEIRRISLQYFFNVNCYLLKTDTGYYLVDTGIKKRRAQIEKELSDAGCQPGGLKLIIITHGHTDHVGNAAYLRESYGAKIAMHEDDVRMVESGDMFIDSRGGVLINLIGSLMRILGFSDYERFTPDVILGDGQSLREYGLDATVIHTPGHSMGSISIHLADGDLFCGDVYSNTEEPERSTLIDDQGALDASVERLKALVVSNVFPGHGEPFSMSLCVH
jgi:glyoxylase-like metal-dependent hydrolase (beta-lactamase superfamily II)